MKEAARALVMGGGVSGLRAAMDLARAGCSVFLAEKQAVPAGLLLGLDRQFPSNHCGLCRVLPPDPSGRTWQACIRRGFGHPGIEFFPGFEVQDIQGSPGNMSATLIRQALMVDTDKCTACMECVEVCPVHMPDLFSTGQIPVKAISRAAPHRPPHHLAISLEACTLCGRCRDACREGAIDLDAAREEKVLDNLDFAVLASGVEYCLPEVYNLYQSAAHTDVITSLDFEGLLSSAGTDILRPSDGRPVRKAAWVQCAGSRNLKLEADHCSGICCMISLKQASLAREKEIQCSIFYMDMRTSGRDWQKYLDRAREKGVELIRCRPHSIEQVPEERSLCIPHAPSPGSQEDRDFDLVVLSVGRDPAWKPPEYAGREGVFTSPGSRRVLDIARSIIAASATAATALGEDRQESLPDPEAKDQDQVHSRVLVVGAGPAGLSAALTLAAGNIPVVLVEQKDHLGGHGLSNISPEQRKEVQDLAARAMEHKLVQVYPSAAVISCTGPAGGFKSRIRDSSGDEKEVLHGAAVLATGGRAAPVARQEDRTADIFEYSRRIFAAVNAGEAPESVIFILCHNTRQEPANYCSRVCCSLALKSCLQTLSLRPEAEVTVFYRDIMVQGDDEELYTRARSEGVRFIPYSPDATPSFEAKDGKIRVKGSDPCLSEESEYEAEQLVLAPGVVPAAGSEMARIFNVHSSAEGFLCEADAKYRPVESGRAGIFICGLARNPVPFKEAVLEGRAAAMSALGLLNQGLGSRLQTFVRVKPALCSLCGLCLEACPFKARYAHEETGVMAVDPLACRGCGACVAVCPNKASAWSEQLEENVHELN